MYKNNHFLGLNWGMKYLSSLLFTVLFLWACTSEHKDLPEGVLAKDKMILVLSDVHLAESAVAYQELNRDTSIFLYRELEAQIFRKHGITRTDFLKSYAWYAEHIDEYKELYSTLVDTLNVRSSIQ